ncbi:Transcription elongation factor greB [Granulibacter bethesdensis]|uniref:Transcription elongation factor greB n=1 Tax=Granulibacter bethesdensis TaxID=364410 RepID=A0AAC9KBC8_9PROT|nr:GreA/GreB family elongation factor [Granulibacter bethesdensis]APH54714.1 Transcription elongation factor greB [Granulibacter bethesdensis]APH62301.1 Transcription elongation factor greB [Granulibacter bethesdensis]
MSRAFVSEDAMAAQAAEVPERPISGRPNLVTASGLSAIEAEIARLQTALAEEKQSNPEESERRAVLARDLRYWLARRASAQLVPPAPDDLEEVAFGDTVQLSLGNRTVIYRIVGEDEADPKQGLISYASPLAEALLGAGLEEEVTFGAGRPPATVLKIIR